MPNETPWTPEELALLPTLWANRSLSASKIGAMMGGRSKSSIVGKAHALNLSSRAAPGYHRPGSKPKSPPKPPRPRYHAHEALPVGAGVPMLSPPPPPTEPRRQVIAAPIIAAPKLTRTCQWIDGDPSKPGWTFCGAPSAGSWCSVHRRDVFAAATVKDAAA